MHSKEIRGSLYFGKGLRPDFNTVRNLFSEKNEVDECHLTASNKISFVLPGLFLELTGIRPGNMAIVPRPLRMPDKFSEFRFSDVETLSLSMPFEAKQSRLWSSINLTFAKLLSDFTHLPGVEAVQWHPARSLCLPDIFQRSIESWERGKDFLGQELISAAPMADGGIQTEGLWLFAGQEVRIEPELVEPKRGNSELALHLAQYFAHNGPLTKPMRFKSPLSGYLRAEPSSNGRFIRVYAEATKRSFGLKAVQPQSNDHFIESRAFSRLARWIPPTLL
ncbi:hypothetical protein [Altericroceibacterium spongiae]|uniref:hypothetical protein n=1 Tax=Altericroceibacterium spongiae TaxID=2320269 RepID=UPI0011C42D33|nr:hypothetical protein [Altericroceibacterium spongiae]